MELTKSLVDKKHLFTKCAICEHIFVEGDPNPRNEEHIIPEFLGGKLKIGMLCKVCNNQMGGGFEDRLAKSFLVKMYADQYQIIGKSRKIPKSPLVGDYKHNQKTISLDRDYKPITQYSMECIENDDQSITFSGSIDASNREQEKAKLVKQMARSFKKKGIIVDEDKIYKQVSEIVDNAPIIEEKPTLHKTITVDYNDINLLLLKIAYETLCIHFGESITNDEYFQGWRASLKTQTINQSVQMGNQSFFDFLKSFKTSGLPLAQTAQIFNFKEFEEGKNKDNILIILTSFAIFVRCMNFWGAFKINKKSPMCLYEHSLAEQKFSVYEDDDFLTRCVDLKKLTMLSPF